MKKLIQYLFVFAAALALAAPALPQALPNLALARLGYTVKKRTTPLEGELKQKIEANDRELAEATRLGRNGEVRRLITKGMALLNGNTWTDELDFSNSIVLRSSHVFVDTSNPYTVRLEQIYTPSLALDHALTAHAVLRKAPQARNGAAAAAQPPETVKDLGSFDEVSRDLIESPCLMELDLSDVADGVYQVHVDVQDGGRSLGGTNLRIVAAKGLEANLTRLEAGARTAPETLRADALYPVDYIRNVNRGRIDIGQFDLAKELAAADQVLSATLEGKDPFAGRTRDFKRHYFLKAAEEIMPYRLYVPPAYNGSSAFPLVVALHGLGGTEDSMFGPNYGTGEQAAKHGYILVAPMGYRVDGGYGRVSNPVNRRAQLSEQDVMEVLARVRHDYRIDDNRIYLMGHSMGGIGTWTLGAKYPNLWAALGPISGNGDPATVQVMRRIPEIVVHGDADTVVPVGASRAMVAEMKKLGVEVKYIEVPGGSHGSVAAPNMAAIFDFFDAHRKRAESTATSR